MASAKSPIVIPSDDSDAPLPSYLRRHVHLGFNQEDVAALLSSIESSQSSSTCTLAHLPAELLLQILEYVPVDYILDWRLVCRGFRDAIDGRVLYHHLRRTELVGYMGARDSRPMEFLDDSDYESIHLLRARFQRVERITEPASDTERSNPVWNGAKGVFKIDDEWFRAFHHVGGAAAGPGDTIEDADPRWLNTLDRLELHRPEEGFGTLRWCIRLDHAVLDLDFPVEGGRTHFGFDPNLHTGLVTIEWRGMLLRFLKTERALRRLLDLKRDSEFSFSHVEDCLRAVRRQRLLASLDSDNKVDRHIKWSLRLLRPLFGKPRHEHQMTLEDVENDAVGLLLLLRREAAMSTQQVAYLRQLGSDNLAMEAELLELDQAFGEFKSYLSMPGFQTSLLIPIVNRGRIPKNPIAWPDDLRIRIEQQVEQWKSQKRTIEQMMTLLEASNTAMAVPDDSFDSLGSDDF
ncbi:hypothetical protein BDW02DRAFT_579392 [Decorospora gaudefroyi]|uniref:F-box domain-containing protein n=1 Tax=Decorospora gaudefroyi TaxID=184978 RepID=A0A6A5KMG6_9PLEO|nr:hypothetical protein BDW02DRAFT_579392 [Decorospora gaudefroyi]